MAEKANVLVNIVSARGLRGVKKSGWVIKSASSNPYCTCQVVGKPNSKFQTSAIEGELNPTWDREDYVEDYAPGDPLLFQVRHQDQKGEGDLLGQVTVSSDQFMPSGFEGELQLSGAEASFLTIKVTPTGGGDAPEEPPENRAQESEESGCSLL